MSETLLPFFQVSRVSGEERASFLHNQLSNDIHQLAQGRACFATYNTPQGRVIANMLVLNTGDELWLVMAQDISQTVIERLKKFILRAKVSLTIAADLGVAIDTQPEHSEAPPPWPTDFQAALNGALWEIALPYGGALQVGPIAQLPQENEAVQLAWRNTELQHGQPWIDAAATEQFVAQMLNQHILGAVHFKKGCYPGQEIIARAQYRGQVKRGLVLLGSPQDVRAGEKILADSEEVGKVVNAVPQTNGCLLLAVIRFDAADKILYTENNADLNLKQRFFEAASTHVQ